MSSKGNRDILTWRQRMVVYYIPFLLLGDLLSLYLDQFGDYVPIMRGMASFIYLMVLLFNTTMDNRSYRAIWYFVLYVSFLFFSASNLVYSMNVSSKVFLSLLCFIVGHYYINTIEAMARLSRVLLITVIIGILNIILSSYFHFGRRTYSLELDLGIVSGLNTYTYLLLCAPLFFMFCESRLKKVLFQWSFIVILIYLIVSFKRISIAGIAVGYAVFFLIFRRHVLMVKYLLSMAIVLTLLSPLYLGILETQFSARSDRFMSGALEEEARYKETPIIWKEILSFENPIKSLFGGEAFNTVGMYGAGSFGGRMAHVDYNGIVISNGLIGFWLYVNIYIAIINHRRRVRINKHNQDLRTANGVFWALIITSLFTSLSGGVMELTFRSIIFLYSGAILRYLQEKSTKIYEYNQQRTEYEFRSRKLSLESN